ncbi:MAG: DNA polymerase III subunit delta [Thermacetogeniaceae bacterium]
MMTSIRPVTRSSPERGSGVPVFSQFEASQRLQRGEIPGLLLIHGEERYLARGLIHTLKAKLASEEAADCLEWDQEDGATELYTALTTMPFGAGTPARRLVVAHNPDADICLPCLKMIGDPSLVLVLLFDTRLNANDKLCRAAAGPGWVVECPPLKGKNLTAWAQGEARLLGKQLPGPAAEYLRFLCGDNPGLISQELEKAILYMDEGMSQITVRVLQETGSRSASRSIFELVDAVAARKSGHAWEFLGDLLDQGGAPVYIANMLARHFLQLLEVSLWEQEGAAPQAISKTMGIHPYVAQKLHQQRASFTAPAVEAILSMLLDLDRSLKQGRGDPGLLLEAAVGEICNQKVHDNQKYQRY